MESAWEGVDRKKAQVIQDPASAAARDGASAMVEDSTEDREELGAAYAAEDEVGRALLCPHFIHLWREDWFAQLLGLHEI